MPMSLKRRAFYALGRLGFVRVLWDASNWLIFKGFEAARKTSGCCLDAAMMVAVAVLEALIALLSHQERLECVSTPGGASGGLWRRELLAQALWTLAA